MTDKKDSTKLIKVNQGRCPFKDIAVYRYPCRDYAGEICESKLYPLCIRYLQLEGSEDAKRLIEHRNRWKDSLDRRAEG